MTPHLHVTRVPDCPLCTGSSLDTGPYCRLCGIHRAMSAGGRCPSCLDDAKKGES
jgi:hypothetical protein